jgi:hypothetical protein
MFLFLASPASDTAADVDFVPDVVDDDDDDDDDDDYVDDGDDEGDGDDARLHHGGGPHGHPTVCIC